MGRYGLLIDYEFCTGCHTCEIACTEAHGLAGGQGGIKLCQVGPIRRGEEGWFFVFVPVPTDRCDLCRERVQGGLQPACVRHCQAGVMKFGTIKELAQYMEVKAHTVLFAPGVPDGSEDHL